MQGINLNLPDNKSKVYHLFKDCFPKLPITEGIFYKLFDYQKCDIVTKYEQEELIGFSAIHEDNIALLCVAPGYQRRGYGTQLVQESERLIKEHGYHTVRLGDINSKLFIGAYTSEREWNLRRNLFFEKYGYTAENGCLEMVMSLHEYSPERSGILLYPEGITFEYWNNADKSDLFTAVGEVEEDWVQYYQYDLPIFVAMEHGKCVGFTILSFDDNTLCSYGNNKVGMVGCVGVIPKKRERGIGLAMVAHATQELKKNGCDLSYIHYTYLDQWYGKLGYQSVIWYWFGKKSLC
jgi:GNAT superfamily N-acetyltransferase